MSNTEDLLEHFAASLPLMDSAADSQHQSLVSRREEAVRALSAAERRAQLLEKQHEAAQQLLTRLAEVRQARVECEQKTAAPCEEQQSQLEELRQRVETWEQVSGAWIKITDKQELRVHFSRLKEGVSRDCYITLDPSAGDVWEVRDCHPTIPGLQLLLDQLNQSKDLGKFCRSVRSGLQRIV